MQGGIASIDSEGRASAMVNPDKKRRQDFLISPHHAWHDALKSALLRPCAPEIKRAFQAEVTQTDRILIARYDDSGGWFGRHRHNVAPNVAFREFAMSVNLDRDRRRGNHRRRESPSQINKRDPFRSAAERTVEAKRV